jgi:3-isopropylmalate/(R)-2-methylmalate dehydratase large subunit
MLYLYIFCGSSGNVGKTLFDKIWEAHAIRNLDDGSTLVYVDRVFLHERTGSVALTSLADAGREVRNPRHVFATMDHILDTFPGRGDDTLVPGGKAFIQTMRRAATASDITLFDIDDPRHGITHLISAEQGITLPGLVVACPDSHTCTLGALGAIGWGIGTSDCEHVLATETLRTTKPRQLRVCFNGSLGVGITAKDMILHLIARYSAAGAAGCAMEYAGPAISALGMDERFTLCNMAVEFSAFTGLIAPDRKTLDYVRGRTMAPSGVDYVSCEGEWLNLASDPDAHFDLEYSVDCEDIEPTVTWGTSPEHAIAINDVVPDPAATADADAGRNLKIALDYMGLTAGQPLRGTPIDAAFIGSCTNARLADLEAAARILDGRKIAPGVKAICTPGSQDVKRAAEQDGLDVIFRAAGFEWREPGCSLCFNAGGEGFKPGERVVSSTNRNFRGRQGPMARTHLASPAMVAAAAIAGAITDCRELAGADSGDPN